MKLHIILTGDNTEVPLVAGSICHCATFAHDTHNHRVVQLARDAAEAVAVAYLRHGLNDVPHGDAGRDTE